MACLLVGGVYNTNKLEISGAVAAAKPSLSVSVSLVLSPVLLRTYNPLDLPATRVYQQDVRM